MKTDVQKVMRREPACCTPATRIKDVAQMMVAQHCGSIPVVENHEMMKLVGMITDRDIVCRTIAQGKNPLEMAAGDVMSRPVISEREHGSLEKCCQLMEEHQIRRIPIVDESGGCCGIVTQAHIARYARPDDVVEVLKDVSRKTKEPSHVMVGV